MSEAAKAIGVTIGCISNAFNRKKEKGGASTILIKKKRYKITNCN